MKPTQFRTWTKGFQSRRLLPKLGFAPLRRYQISGTQCVVEGTPPPQEVKIYCRSPFTIVGSTRSLTGISTVYFVLSGGDVTATTYERKHIAQKVQHERWASDSISHLLSTHLNQRLKHMDLQSSRQVPKLRFIPPSRNCISGSIGIPKGDVLLQRDNISDDFRRRNTAYTHGGALVEHVL